MLIALSACSDPERDLPPAYRDVRVPVETLASPAAQTRGRMLFEEHCALCHGEAGDGRGARHAYFAVPPADFTSPAWRHRSTPRTVFHAIREGVHGTPMPAWKALSPEESWDLVSFVLSVGERAPTPQVPR